MDFKKYKFFIYLFFVCKKKQTINNAHFKQKKLTHSMMKMTVKIILLHFLKTHGETEEKGFEVC